MPGYVFISYSRADQEYVDALAARLGAQGVDAWIDKSIDYGSRWPRVIKEKVDNCGVFVVVMTPDAEDSAWVGREIDEAESMARPILPLLLRGARFFRLAEHQFEDVRGGAQPSDRWFLRIRELADAHAGAGEDPGAPATPAGARGEVRVDAFGGGEFATIAEAVEAVPPGTRIVVAPGLYRGPVVFEKPVTLAGDGEVVMEARSDFRVTAAACRLQQLTLRRQSVLARGKRSRGRKHCITVMNGHLELLGCDVSSDPPGFADCISVGEGGSVRLVGNRIHHGAVGLVFREKSGGIVEENEIFAASENGVSIGGVGTNPRLSRNSIHDNDMHGVAVWLNGRPTIEENEIHRNGMSGLWLLDGANPLVRSNRVFGNPVGVQVEPGASATLERNELYGNEHAVVYPESGRHWVELIDNVMEPDAGPT